MGELRLVAALAVLVSTLSGPAGSQPRSPDHGAPPRSIEVNLAALPWTHRQPKWTVVVRNPAPDIRKRGGSGGSMFEVEVAGPAQAPIVFVVQAIGMALTDLNRRWPALQVWSAAGGGTYTRAVYRWQAGRRRYCADRVDEFEDHGDEGAKDGVVRIAGNSRLVRYARSRPFGCEPADR